MINLKQTIAEHRLWRLGEGGSRADLSRADLPEANLSRADLSRANLSGADLSEANLSGAKGYVCLGNDPRGYHFRAVRKDDGWHITAGCRCFTLLQASVHWKDNPDATARLAILSAHS